MKTDDLVTLLATGATAIEPNATTRRYATALGLGTLGAALMMVAVLGVRPDFRSALQLPMLWVKFAFVASLAVMSGFVALRLCRPGSKLAGMPGLLAVPVIVIWVLAAFALTTSDPAVRQELFFGRTWTTCPWFIALFSLPVFVAVIWAMQGLAPTRLRLAGAAAGLVAGSVGALVYTLHCPEMAAPFLGTWYLLGILIPTGMGTFLGPRLLRW